MSTVHIKLRFPIKFLLDVYNVITLDTIPRLGLQIFFEAHTALLVRLDDVYFLFMSAADLVKERQVYVYGASKSAADLVKKRQVYVYGASKSAVDQSAADLVKERQVYVYGNSKSAADLLKERQVYVYGASQSGEELLKERQAYVYGASQSGEELLKERQVYVYGASQSGEELLKERQVYVYEWTDLVKERQAYVYGASQSGADLLIERQVYVYGASQSGAELVKERQSGEDLLIERQVYVYGASKSEADLVKERQSEADLVKERQVYVYGASKSEADLVKERQVYFYGALKSGADLTAQMRSPTAMGAAILYCAYYAIFVLTRVTQSIMSDRKKRNRGHEKKSQKTDLEEDSTADQQPAVDETSPVIQMFRSFQQQLDSKHDKHERIVKLSRLQEYIEALTFLFFLKNNHLISLEDVQKRLTFTDTPPVDDSQSEGASQAPVETDSTADQSNPSELKALTVWVPTSEYVLGIADLTGEMMRRAINSVGDGDLTRPFEICTFLQEMESGYSGLTNCNREVNRKLTVLRQSLRKVENACYTLRVRGSEIPKHMLVDMISKSSGAAQFIEELGVDED
ncbi:TSNAX-like protein [Mya arenaria]|uniref:TSNAX-like protein n=1 Tax=Mya arenaria TaxID=6604 RepID=A0ABY7FGM6_MYAAR|nr:TSNAX-like protein [Mya arenaria]